MQPLFTARADRLLRTALVLGALALVAAPTALLAWVRTPHVTGQFDAIEQPIPFDHRHHVIDDGIDCRYCHETAERSRYAGVPSTATCMNCHAQVWRQSPQLEPVHESWFGSKPLRWNRVHRLPGFVYFDHSAHLNAGVGCETCHGRVDQMPAVYQFAPLTMQWCLECHRAPERHLRPRSAVAVMGWEPPPGTDRGSLGRELAARYGVRHLTHCSTCHR